MLINDGQTQLSHSVIGKALTKKALLDEANKEQFKDAISDPRRSLIDSEYRIGKPMTEKQLETEVLKANASLRSYEHPFNPNLKFFSYADWTPKSGFPTLLYPKGVIPENTLFNWIEEKVAKPHVPHVDRGKDAEEQLFDIVKKPGTIAKLSWKTVLRRMLAMGWLSGSQFERLISKYASSRADIDLAKTFGLITNE